MAATSELLRHLFELPHWFEAHDGLPLYAVFHPARSAGNSPSVVLFCHSLGLDHLVTWRMDVLAARAIAAGGRPAFSYHARGHGDSAGSFADLTFDSLVEDALDAAGRARELSGAARIVWVATRFGALVAAAAMRRRTDSAGLVLWEPVHRARDYFHGLMRRRLFFEVANGRRPALNVEQMIQRLGGGRELPLAAEWLHEPLYRTALDADLARALDGWNGPTLLAQVQKRESLSPDNAALLGALLRAGASAETVEIVEQPTWENPAEPWWTSPRLIAETNAWLGRMA